MTLANGQPPPFAPALRRRPRLGAAGASETAVASNPGRRIHRDPSPPRGRAGVGSSGLSEEHTGQTGLAWRDVFYIGASIWDDQR